MKQIITLFLIIGYLSSISAQVGIGTTSPDAGAELDISSTNKGFLMPRLADTTAVTSPSKGMMFYDESRDTYMFYDGSDWKSIVYTDQAQAEYTRYAGQVKVNGRVNGGTTEKLIFSAANGNQIGANPVNGAIADADFKRIDFSDANFSNNKGKIRPMITVLYYF